ncbi:hypothetical protein UA08_01597 [Talaromyces atroroseus]|uniref:Uncharacterized protein n=1 Tax=Talaromyces atroroseus TaxID=1441469 RepID=A0A1Q5QBE0_TALAT|nr:hypothetical protein UA08_01597 [Talaromyces atroroseus]OKL63255.1 hypothetical protein UA08_01597 [Talaromyces atroroseus]
MRICLRSGRPLQLGSRFHINRCHGLTTSILGSDFVSGPPTRLPTRKIATATEAQTLSRNPVPFRDVSIKGEYVYSKRLSAFRPRNAQNAAAWMRQLEPFLPPDLRDATTLNDVPTPASLHVNTPHGNLGSEGESIADIIRHARVLGNLDLLAYLGFTLQRWPAVHALITKMLDAADNLQENLQYIQGLPSNLKWQHHELKLITSDSYARSLEGSRPGVAIVSGFEKLSGPSSVEHFTDEPRSNMTSLGIMGEIWQTLGFIVVAAADKSTQESELAMSYVYQTLARLHHSGKVSDAIYKFSKRPDDDVLFRPPGLYLLSTHIMNVLSDAAWLVHQANVTAKAKAAGEDSPYRSFKMGVRQLGHEIWLEFILWSCIEQGHIKEGVWILRHVQGMNYGAAWKMISWNPLLNQPDLVSDTNIDIDDFWPHPDIQRTPEEAQNKSGSFHGLGKLTISTEVVTALATHAANYMKTDVRSDSSDAEDMVESLAFLNRIKQSHSNGQAPSLNTTSRQIVQVLEVQRLRPDMHPGSLERVIDALPPPMPPWDDSVPVDHKRLSALSKYEIYSSSSMLAGILQQNLRLYSSDREIESAMRVFTRLLKIIDTSKMDRIREFWGKDKDTEGLHAPSLEPNSLPEASVRIDQSSIPTLSNGTLADLLDLVTTAKAFDFGEWLLFSSDADGPTIPFESYGDQSLAPSILRFAAATRNRELGDVVIQQLRYPISRNTFNALANFRIMFEQWDEAERILDLLRQYRQKTWGESTLATLASAILRLEQKVWENPMAKDAEESLLRAEDLLRRILSGEYNPKQHSDKKINHHYDRAIYRWHSVLSSTPGRLAQTCGEVKLNYTNSSRRDALPYIPSVAFHVLLNALVETRGSQIGMDMWKMWCVDIERSHAPRLTEDGIYRLHKSADPKTEEPLDLDLEFDWAWFWEKQRKAVIPNLNTLRIITRAAVKEFKEITHSPKTMTAIPTTDQFKSDVYKVLDFCVERYRRFKRDKDEIDRETSGHLRRLRKGEANKRKNLRKKLVRWVYADVGQADSIHNLIKEVEKNDAAEEVENEYQG